MSLSVRDPERHVGVGLSRSVWEYPLIQSSISITVAVVATVAAIAFGTSSVLGLAAAGAAVMFAAVSVLILGRSRAVLRIHTLRIRNKELHAKLARARIYSDELDDILQMVREFRSGRRVDQAGPLIQRILETAAVRCSAVCGGAVQFFIVRTTTEHVVRWAAGADGLSYKAGASCSADRSLRDVVERMHVHHSISRLTIEGSSHSIVVVSEETLTDAETLLAERVAALIELAVGQMRGPTATNEVRLRAV